MTNIDEPKSPSPGEGEDEKNASSDADIAFDDLYIEVDESELESELESERHGQAPDRKA
jgi:hypothetical protein